MPQQINLSSPLLLKQKQYFSAQTMAWVLAIFLLLGGALCATWVWSLKSSSAGYSQAMAAQAQEVASLQAAIARRKASAAPADPALVQQLQARRALVQQREDLLQALRQGVLRAGEGHSDRLQLIARSIPATVWVTEVNADASRFELTGFTLEPSALNVWVEKLAVSPLMRGLTLDTVRVENTAAAQLRVPTAVAAGAASAARAVWSFHLVSVQPAPVALAAAAGEKP